MLGLNAGAKQKHWVPAVAGKDPRSLFQETERERKALVATFLDNRRIVEECPLRVTLTLAQSSTTADVQAATLKMNNLSWNKTCGVQVYLENIDVNGNAVWLGL